jgi:hypothetical protein
LLTETIAFRPGSSSAILFFFILVIFPFTGEDKNKEGETLGNTFLHSYSSVAYFSLWTE